MKIRPALPSDIEFILLAHQALNKMGPHNSSVLSEAKLQEDIFSNNPKAFILIAERDFTPIGMAFYSFNYFPVKGQIIWLSNLYITEQERRSGVSEALIKSIQERHQDTYICWITHNANEPMIAFSTKIKAKKIENFFMYGLATNVS